MIENDGSTDRFRIGAAGSDDNWTVKYFRGTTNITSAVEDGTYQTRSLGHGEKVMLKVKVRIRVGLPDGRASDHHVGGQPEPSGRCAHQEQPRRLRLLT